MNFFKSSAPIDPRKSIFEFTVRNNDGTPIPLETFRGKSPILIVNVASQ
jgi:glutathione peroxidase-family protein